jgi:tRNA(fMet)-specific endonuclease VapC
VEVIADTNALSAFADGDVNVMRPLRQASQLAIPVVVLGEYRFGIAQSRKRSDYELWLEETLPLCRVIDIDRETSVWYAEIRLELKRAGKPVPSNDLWIAALCRQHCLPLLSQDRHFDFVAGLRRISW